MITVWDRSPAGISGADRVGVLFAEAVSAGRIRSDWSISGPYGRLTKGFVGWSVLHTPSGLREIFRVDSTEILERSDWVERLVEQIVKWCGEAEAKLEVVSALGGQDISLNSYERQVEAGGLVSVPFDAENIQQWAIERKATGEQVDCEVVGAHTLRVNYSLVGETLILRDRRANNRVICANERGRVVLERRN